MAEKKLSPARQYPSPSAATVSNATGAWPKKRASQSALSSRTLSFFDIDLPEDYRLVFDSRGS